MSNKPVKKIPTPIIISHNFTLSFNIIGKSVAVMRILERILRLFERIGITNVNIVHEMEYDQELAKEYIPTCSEETDESDEETEEE